MSKRQKRTAMFGLLLLPSFAGCGPSVEDEPELYERRRPGCEQWCEVVLDPDCGIPDTPLEDAQECEELCMSEENTLWGLQEDGTDACFDEYVEFYDCVGGSTCEEQRIAVTNPAGIHETQCGLQLEAVLDCNLSHNE